MKRCWRLVLIGLTLGASMTGGGAAWREDARPNFVFLYTDDQRWDTLGVVQREQGEKGRFPWLESPNLDRLAASGVRFNQWYSQRLCRDIAVRAQPRRVPDRPSRTLQRYHQQPYVIRGEQRDPCLVDARGGIPHGVRR